MVVYISQIYKSDTICASMKWTQSGGNLINVIRVTPSFALRPGLPQKI